MEVELKKEKAKAEKEMNAIHAVSWDTDLGTARKGKEQRREEGKKAKEKGAKTAHGSEGLTAIAIAAENGDIPKSIVVGGRECDPCGRKTQGGKKGKDKKNHKSNQWRAYGRRERKKGE